MAVLFRFCLRLAAIAPFLVANMVYAQDAAGPGSSCAAGHTAGAEQAHNNGIFLCTTTGATLNWYPEPLYIGASSATCDTAHASLLRYNSGSLEVCNGSAWVTAGSGGVLGSSAAAANPQRSGEANTGLFSTATGVVAVASLGTEALRVTATGSIGIGTTTPGGTVSVVSGNTTGTTSSGALNLTANSLTSGEGLYAGSTSVTSGAVAHFKVSGTAAATGQAALWAEMLGANATATQTTYGGIFENKHTGTASTNVALYAGATGGNE